MTDKEFNPDELEALLAFEISAAQTYDNNERADTRAENIEYLRGEMSDVSSRPNGSAFTSRDMNDVVSWTLPSTMRVFTASDRMGVFEPERPEDEDYAEQATDYVNYIFWRDNDGYRNLYNATYDAIAVAGDAIVKSWWDDTPIYETVIESGLSAAQIASLMEDEEVEILTQEDGDPQQIMIPDEQTGEIMPMTMETFNVKLRRVRMPGKYRLMTLAPENFLIDSAALDIEDFRFCAHRDPQKTRSDLIEMGFDRDKVDVVAAESTTDVSQEAYARVSQWSTVAKARQYSMDRIDLYECYIKVDVDGDGVSETVQVFYAGSAGANGVVLDWEVWEDDVPFTKISCYPIPHKFTSDSMSSRTKDIQQVKTVLLRQGLDNLYASNLPMQEVYADSIMNPDILTNPKFGGIIWKKKTAPEKAVIPHEVPFVADKAFAALEMMDGIIEKRTGVSRTMMALDPEVLQNQTATASQNARDASYSQIELIARNMAEGWRKVYAKILKGIVKHQDRPRVIRLRDEYQEMDPRAWDANMDCTINVGLGTGSRDRDMQMLMVILNEQKQAIAGLYQAGAKEEAIKMLPKIAETQNKLTEAAGIKNPEQFWPDFDEETIKKLLDAANQPQVDPKIELEKQKMQLQAQQDERRLQIDMEAEKLKAEGNTAKETAQMQADLEVKAAERNNELMISQANQNWEREKFTAELQFKYAELAAKTEMDKQKAEAMAMKNEEAANGAVQ